MYVFCFSSALGARKKSNYVLRNQQFRNIRKIGSFVICIFCIFYLLFCIFCPSFVVFWIFFRGKSSSWYFEVSPEEKIPLFPFQTFRKYAKYTRCDVILCEAHNLPPPLPKKAHGHKVLWSILVVSRRVLQKFGPWDRVPCPRVTWGPSIAHLPPRRYQTCD